MTNPTKPQLTPFEKDALARAPGLPKLLEAAMARSHLPLSEFPSKRVDHVRNEIEDAYHDLRQGNYYEMAMKDFAIFVALVFDGCPSCDIDIFCQAENAIKTLLKKAPDDLAILSIIWQDELVPQWADDMANQAIWEKADATCPHCGKVDESKFDKEEWAEHLPMEDDEC